MTNTNLLPTPDRLFAAGFARHQAGDLPGAAALYARVLAAAPAHAEALHHLGLTFAQRGEAARAVELIRRALAQNPQTPRAHYNLGNALRRLGREEEAVSAYRAALAQDPAAVAAWTNLGAALRALGRHEEGIAAAREAVARAAGDPAVHYNLGCALQHGGALGEAVEAYRAALRLDPGLGDAAANLGAALMALGRPMEALPLLRAQAQHQPGDAAAQLALAEAYLALGAGEAAVVAARRATTLAPRGPEAWAGLARALREVGESREAVAASRRACQLAPQDTALRLALAASLQEQGEQAAARAQAEAAVEAEPGSPAAWSVLAGLVTFAPGDARIARMQALARDLGEQAAPEARVQLGFALGKALMDAGEVDAAFAALLQANRLHRAGLAYAVEEDAAAMAAMAAAPMAAQVTGPAAQARPIFIVGMPRSGTTLTEQILAAHPAIASGGEMKHLELALCTHFRGVPKGAQWGERMATLDPPALRAIAEDYLRRVSGGRGEAAQAARRGMPFTDKMPANFRLAGLITRLFPQALIIDCRRDALDTCLSCFATQFAQGQPFTYDLAELGAYYRAYRGLMAHWRQALPAGRLLTLDYEALVRDIEGEARRLVAACGLAWDARCLDFHRSARSVRTASVNQVRRPLYASSVGRAGPYAGHLAALGLG